MLKGLTVIVKHSLRKLKVRLVKLILSPAKTGSYARGNRLSIVAHNHLLDLRFDTALIS